MFMFLSSPNYGKFSGFEIMQISIAALLLLVLTGVASPVARAENISIPDKNHRREMSYEEYSNYREKMRMQMKQKHPEESKRPPDTLSHPADQAEKQKPDGAYGQGYRARNRTDDKPDSPANNRPDRPRFERFSRGDMMRR
jgi:hypothetical protein